ncbi:cysteine desulfurase-like protein [Protaetiibacter intestinalis]|uniref:Cysteine desulfurase-like protein n=1 Tax=Protaetiibacter intestinalis TaxID=2419774 RepID=A0A387B9S7_9MICO|nr:cysteine desulfurase-like protein [Protaetiibacter intestinalis]AYF97915.1 cysteine desulfurase-like protein [Protaetiibacter intestinalis]
MSYDVAAFRAQFPALATGVAHFDGPGGTQTPTAVGEAIARTLTGPLSNRGTSTRSERNATDAVLAMRAAVGALLNVPASGVVYGRSATQLAYDFSRHLSRDWHPGDEVVVTRLDHDSNVRPWVQAAERTGATVRWIQLDPATGELRLDELRDVLSERTRVVALTAASNLIGTIPPVRAVADAAHAVGALVYVDAVHYAAHELVDRAELGADFVVCSPYKFLGPHCAVLGADPELLATIRPDKLAPSTDAVPERFEFGTLPYELMAGVTAAVEVLAAIAPGAATTRREALAASFAAVHAHESALLARLEAGIAELGDRVVVYSRAARRTPTLLLGFPGRSAEEASALLAARDVHAPASNFYALEASRALGLGDAGALRAGLAPYSTADEVDRLLDGIRAFLTS